ncbi:MAG: hypothetical protein AAGK04_00345 [Planctomycetota bacterium]
MPVSLDPAWELRRYLKDRDAPCPRCGYNLRDLQRETCPECHLYLRIEAVRRAARGKKSQVRTALPWLGALVGALALWGLVIGLVWHSMRTSGALPVWFNSCVIAVLGLVVAPVTIGGLVWLYRARAEDRKRHKNRD